MNENSHKMEGIAMLDGFLSTREVAEIFGVTQQAVQAWRKKRQGPPWVRFKGIYVYPKDQLKDWIAKRDVHLAQDVPA